MTIDYLRQATRSRLEGFIKSFSETEKEAARRLCDLCCKGSDKDLSFLKNNDELAEGICEGQALACAAMVLLMRNPCIQTHVGSMLFSGIMIALNDKPIQTQARIIDNIKDYIDQLK